jgi:hypothetical protein
MSEPLKSKVIVERDASGNAKIGLVDVQSGRVIPTGIKVQGTDAVDQQVRRVKEQLERAGQQVSVHEK